MCRITIDQYEFALMRYEELFLMVCGAPKAGSRNAIEMDVMSQIVAEYEHYHFQTRE